MGYGIIQNIGIMFSLFIFMKNLMFFSVLKTPALVEHID